MGEKRTTQWFLVVVLVSFFAFGLVHDMDHGALDPMTTVDHEEPIPHVEEICALTVMGAVMGLGLRRARIRCSPVVIVPPHATTPLCALGMSAPPRCSGFQLTFPMLA